MASSAAATEEKKLIEYGILLSTPPSSTPELLTLLEKVESELRSIGQDASVSMKKALKPLRKALSETKLLEHPDDIIEVSVTSCICEIFRIFAPDEPYGDRKMKEIFHHIIASLEKLDDIHRTCYSKAMRVLEVVAKLRLCEMLLDLDHILAVNIFKLFLKTIRFYHSIHVLIYMEDIMTNLIEASDEVSIDFQVSILESLSMKTMAIAPWTSLLATLVLVKCAARLKPCLLELMKTMNLNFADHSDVLESICRQVPEGENTVENAGSVPPVEGTSAIQFPQVPLLDGIPTTTNNKEPDGLLKTLKHCNQAEHLKDTDAPSDSMQQKMNLNGLSEKIRSDKGQDVYASDNDSALPSETGKQSMPDLLAPNCDDTVCPSSTATRNTLISSGNYGKRGRPKKEEETVSCAEKSSLQRNDFQNISSRTRYSRKQAVINKKVENAGSVAPTEGTSAFQLPQVPLLDGAPPTVNNNDSNEEPDGSLKTLKHCNQAEQLKDTYAPSDSMQQQMNLSGLSENIRPDKGHDCFGMNERKICVEESSNKKEQEKKSGSSSDNAGLKDLALPSETGKQSMPDLLAPNSAKTVCPSSGSSRKRGRPKKNRTDLNVRKISEGTSSRKRGRPKKNEASPSLTVSIKKEEETTSDAEKSSLQRNDLQNISSRTRHSRKQALNNKKVENAGSVPSALQLPQVPLLDGTPPTMNNNDNNEDRDGSLKTSKHCNQAELVKDTGAPSDPMQQQMNLSGLSENIRLDKGHDCFGMNERKICFEESTNKKEQEKKSGSSLDNAGLKGSALPSGTGMQSMPDLLAPNSAKIVCPSTRSSRKRGRPKKNQTDLNVRKISEGNSSRKRGRPKKNEASPSLTVSIKKEEETASDAEKSSLQQNDLQNISSRTRHSRKQALSNKKDSKKLPIVKDYGEELVGANVRVWWPLDKMFYEGVVSSFDPKTKKHKVTYTDDDEEILNLNRECWELLEEEPVTDFPPEVSAVSEKKTQGSGSTSGESIKSDKTLIEDNSTTDAGSKPCDNSENTPRIKETIVPSCAFSKEAATDIPPEVSATSLKKKRKG